MLLRKLQIIYYWEPDSYIRCKVKVVLGLIDYANKKELENARAVDIFDLAAKKDFLALLILVIG